MERISKRVFAMVLGATLIAPSLLSRRAAALPPFGVLRGAGTELTGVKDGLFCLWKGAGFGHESFEKAAWIVRASDGRSTLIPWPTQRSFRRATWSGPIPPGTVACVHTHPDGQGVQPSQADLKVAARLGVPVVVVTRWGIWAAEEDGKTESWASGDWFREAAAGSAPCP